MLILVSSPTPKPLRFPLALSEPMPRFLAWFSLVGAILALALILGAGYQYRQAKLEFRQFLAGLALKDQQGASFFRLRIDREHPPRYIWKPLFIGPLEHPDGPLPGQEDYKVKAVAVFNLDKTQRLYFRIKGNDGISVLVQGQRLFDEWRPVHLGILTDFNEVVGAGLNLLEVDVYLGHNKGTLEVRILDALGQEVELVPLSLGLDAGHWQELGEKEALARSLRGLGVLLLILFLLIPPAWVAIRNPGFLRQWLEAWRPLERGFLLGFCLMLLYQAITYLGMSDEEDIRHLIAYPLLGGLLGGMVQFATLGRGAGQARSAQAGPGRLKAWYLAREAWLTPLLVFGGALLFWSWAVDARGGEFPGTWLSAPWDAKQYKDIMVRGLVAERLEYGAIQGNYAWHPFFPWLARGFYRLGLGEDWALLAMAWLASAAAYQLVFRLARELFGLGAARWSVLAMACYPASFYLFIGYPYGTAIALTSGYALAIQRGRYWLACLLGAGLGMTYPTAVLAGVIPIFMLVPRLRRESNPWPSLRALFIAGAGPALGLGSLCLVHWRRFGDFFLPVAAHGKWGRQAMWPWDTILDGILHEPPQYPEAIITVLIMVAMVAFAHRFNAALWALLLAVFAIGPATGSLESTYRQYLMAWPLFILLGSSPRSPWLKASLFWIMLYLGMTWYLPLWLVGDLV